MEYKKIPRVAQDIMELLIPYELLIKYEVLGGEFDIASSNGN